MANQKRASMREGPLAALFRRTEELQEEGRLDEHGNPIAPPARDLVAETDEPSPGTASRVNGSPAAVACSSRQTWNRISASTARPAAAIRKTENISPLQPGSAPSTTSPDMRTSTGWTSASYSRTRPSSSRPRMKRNDVVPSVTSPRTPGGVSATAADALQVGVNETMPGPGTR